MVGTNMFSSLLHPETIINKDQRSSFSGPKHIKESLLQYQPAQCLRSAGSHLLMVPRIKSRLGEPAVNIWKPHLGDLRLA